MPVDWFTVTVAAFVLLFVLTMGAILWQALRESRPVIRVIKLLKNCLKKRA